MNKDKLYLTIEKAVINALIEVGTNFKKCSFFMSNKIKVK